MDFYQVLSAYYDRLFPLEPVILYFLLNHLDKSGPTADIACGTGTYSIPLAAHGYRVTGVDQDPAMIGKAEEKRKALDEKTTAELLSFRTGTMEGIAESLDGEQMNAFCIGNSLVHLPGPEAVASFFSGLKTVLVSGSRIVIQIINFDRVLDSGVTEIPALESEGIRFSRRYVHSGDGRRVLFDTRLELDDGRDRETFEQQLPLYPLRSDELLMIAAEAGFSDLSLYGSYQGDPYGPESFLTILTAQYRPREEGTA